MLDWLRDLRKSAETRREERTIAYVDGQLSDAESKLFEQEMASDSALREDVAQLRRVKSTLREIPRQRVPHNFTLDPAVYGKPTPAYGARAYPILQGATVLAALVFVIMATLTLSPFGNASLTESIAYDTVDTAAEPAMSAPMAEPPMAESLILEEEAMAEEVAVEEAEMMDADSAETATGSADDSVVDEGFSAEMARSSIITATTAADFRLEMQDADAATDDEVLADIAEDNAGSSMANESDAMAEEAPPEAAAAEPVAAPTIALLPTATITSAPIAQALELEPTVVITVSQAGPDDVNVLSGEDATVEEIQTVEAPPQRSIEPLQLWTLILGLLFLGLLIITFIIRRQL